MLLLLLRIEHDLNRAIFDEIYRLIILQARRADEGLRGIFNLTDERHCRFDNVFREVMFEDRRVFQGDFIRFEEKLGL